MSNRTPQVWLPDYIYKEGSLHADTAIVCDEHGKVLELLPAASVANAVRLANQVLLPGLVNAHSHSFQRVIRGRTEFRSADKDSFWTWRDQMYQAANRLDPNDLYVAARMAFLEMALNGITAVGEFHYLHHSPDGTPYADPNLLAKEVIRAATDIGLRIALLRVAYVRSGFNREANPLQRRFIDPTTDTYLRSVDQLRSNLSETKLTSVGVAPHSVRAVPLNYLKEIINYAADRRLPIHMHVAEQPAEVSDCIEEYGRSPFALLETEGLLSQLFTAVHAIHATPKAIGTFARTGASICACPTTERNLGDGVVPVDAYFANGVPVSLGTDSQTHIDLLEDARELEYHLRLQHMARNVLAPEDATHASLATLLFECATVNGSASLRLQSRQLEPGSDADFFTIDLNDPAIAGSSIDELLPNIIFSASRASVRNVVVAGKQIVSNGQHNDQESIVENFQALQRRLWN